MSEDESEDEGPAVELGDGEPVEGAPLARVSSRLTWGIKHSTVVEREGDTLVRTPDGAQEAGDAAGRRRRPLLPAPPRVRECGA